jgi:hypothetical protein
MDPATLAAAAIAAALPYVTALGKKAADAAAGAAGKSIWEWIKGKLTSEAGKEVVTDLGNAPTDVDNRKAAEAALSKFLKSDPNALAELTTLLERAGVTSTTLSANVTGNENVVAQGSGSGISIAINKGSARPAAPAKGDVE